MLVFYFYFALLTAYLQGLVLQLCTASLFKLYVILKQEAKRGDEEEFGTVTKSVLTQGRMRTGPDKKKVII